MRLIRPFLPFPPLLQFVFIKSEVKFKGYGNENGGKHHRTIRPWDCVYSCKRNIDCNCKSGLVNSVELITNDLLMKVTLIMQSPCTAFCILFFIGRSLDCYLPFAFERTDLFTRYLRLEAAMKHKHINVNVKLKEKIILYRPWLVKDVKKHKEFELSKREPQQHAIRHY